MDKVKMCQAKSKQTGKTCHNFAVKGKRVCHIHGGKSTGAQTPEGKLRQKMASWKHGRFSKEAREGAKAFRAFMQEYKECLLKLR
jgi:hypothetical protein